MRLVVDSSSSKSIYVTDPEWSDFFDDNSTDEWSNVPLKVFFADENREETYQVPQLIMAALRPIITRVNSKGRLTPRHVPLTSASFEIEPGIGLGIVGVYEFNKRVSIWLSYYQGDVSLSIDSGVVLNRYKCGVGSAGGEMVSSIFNVSKLNKTDETNPYFLPK